MKRVGASQSAEKGQSLVLIILSILVLFGFAALAVDMGQIYMTRRAAQSAADAAALAAAYDAVAGSLDSTAARARAFEIAAINGYNNDGITNWVVVNNPPVGGPGCGICNSERADEYYQVRITVNMDPIFAQLVYNGEEQTTIEAVAQGKDIVTITGLDALVSTSTASDSFIWDGNTSANVSGGNIRSMGGMTKNGASGSIVVSHGEIYYATSWSGTKVPFTPVKPVKQAGGNLEAFEAPWCPTAAQVNDGTWTSGSGFKQKNINGTNYYYYPSGLSVENLPSGIHCVQGGIGKGDYYGKGVLIVLLSGGIKQTGGDSLTLMAPLDIVDGNGNHFGGMMMYVPKSNTEELQIGGNSDAYVQGTIYAPGAFCKIGGSSTGTAYHTSFVCNKFKIHGNPELRIIYKQEEQFRLPPAVELTQ